MDDDKDPKDVLEERCRQTEKCRVFVNRLEKCTARVQSHPGTEETCSEELIDLLACVDHCVCFLSSNLSNIIELNFL